MSNFELLWLFIGLWAVGICIQLRNFFTSENVSQATLRDAWSSIPQALASWMMFLFILALIAAPVAGILVLLGRGSPSWRYLPYLILVSTWLPLEVFHEKLEERGRDNRARISRENLESAKSKQSGV